MSQASKFFDPNTGTTVFRDCLTGAELTAAQIAAILPCPSDALVNNEVCIQPIGNTDPDLVENDAKQICTIRTTYLANGDIDTVAPVGAPLLLDKAGADVTATHEVTACPSGLVFAGEVCYTA